MKIMARRFFILALVYLLATIIWVLVFVDEPVPFLARNAYLAGFFIKSLTSSGYNFLFIMAAIVMAKAYHGWRRTRWGQILVATFLALVGIAVFMAAFAAVETSFVMVMPFYADAAFLEMDRWLLFGEDAWGLVHRVLPELGAPLVDLIYGRIWIPVVFLFPLFLFSFDNNKQRIARYILLYFVAFFVVGNVLALIFLSVGPVYYDRYYGANTFAGLKQALDTSGVAASYIGQVQTTLGEMFFANDGSEASDIAAFPSVHVASIMVVTLYAIERSRILGAVMAVLSAAILFLSVYTGYHWLVDGLASILIMIAANFWLKKSRLPRLLSA